MSSNNSEPKTTEEIHKNIPLYKVKKNITIASILEDVFAEKFLWWSLKNNNNNIKILYVLHLLHSKFGTVPIRKCNKCIAQVFLALFFC